MGVGRSDCFGDGVGLLGAMIGGQSGEEWERMEWLGRKSGGIKVSLGNGRRQEGFAGDVEEREAKGGPGWG